VHQLPSSVQAANMSDGGSHPGKYPPPLTPPSLPFSLQGRWCRSVVVQLLSLTRRCACCGCVCVCVCGGGGTGWQLSMDPYGRPVYVPLGTAPPGTTVVGSMAMGAARGQPIATAPPASLTQPLTLTHPPATSSAALLSSLRTLTLPAPSLQAWGSSGARDQQLTCLCRVRLLFLDSSAAWMGGR
jgi:hypothetical protein